MSFLVLEASSAAATKPQLLLRRWGRGRCIERRLGSHPSSVDAIYVMWFCFWNRKERILDAEEFFRMQEIRQCFHSWQGTGWQVCGACRHTFPPIFSSYMECLAFAYDTGTVPRIRFLYFFERDSSVGHGENNRPTAKAMVDQAYGPAGVRCAISARN